ncbi:SPOR domain-containing protein [Kangiella spongicola]|nr:SPOR domain-containing protein [Kangiella spongicola]
MIKYQVPNGGFAVMEGEFGSGKSSFAKIFEKKVVLDEKIDCQIVQVHPLSTIQQIQAQLPKKPEKPLIVIIDDAHEASTLLLQKFTQPQENIYWLLLAEPGIDERVDAFAERKVELPLFSKEDCYEFLQKQLQDQPKYVQVSQMQSDTIWYSSQGLPKNIIDQAKQNLSKLFSGQESSENFEKANKSWYMTAALGAAGLAFIVLLIINIATNDDDTENGVEAPGGELVIESLETGAEQNSYTSSEQPETTVLSKDNLGSSGPDQLSDSRNNTEQFGNEFRTVENSASSTSDMTISANGGEQHTDKSKPDNQPSLSQAEVDEAAESSDPIESIALKVARKDVVATAEPRQNEDFNSWLARHSQDAYSMQLFSHTEKAAAERFQKSLDLADSYVYQANLDGKIRYRVLWGAFDTRAEAQQAIESLPEDILAQQPWIRQFSAIAKEVSQ